ncbi:MAG: hypothetical protein ACKOOG_04065 [Actinomycetota bacterium]
MRRRVTGSGNGVDERGLTTVQYVTAVGFSLLLFVLLANLVVDLYARGAVRSALEEGARAAVPIDVAFPGSACATRARDGVDAVLGGSLVRVQDLECRVAEGRIVARARLVMPSWIPAVVPGWSVTLRATARRER